MQKLIQIVQNENFPIKNQNHSLLIANISKKSKYFYKYKKFHNCIHKEKYSDCKFFNRRHCRLLKSMSFLTKNSAF